MEPAVDGLALPAGSTPLLYPAAGDDTANYASLFEYGSQLRPCAGRARARQTHPANLAGYTGSVEQREELQQQLGNASTMKKCEGGALEAKLRLGEGAAEPTYDAERVVQMVLDMTKCPARSAVSPLSESYTRLADSYSKASVQCAWAGLGAPEVARSTVFKGPG